MLTHVATDVRTEANKVIITSSENQMQNRCALDTTKNDECHEPMTGQLVRLQLQFFHIVSRNAVTVNVRCGKVLSTMLTNFMKSRHMIWEELKLLCID
jgi:hypothetical protein